jgi:spermidine synthase
MQTPSTRRTLYFVIFTLSGFSGLIYESIWTHYLKLFLGHAAYAQTLVLAIFMGGLTIGSWLCSRYSLRWENLLRGYALAEGAIGILALVFHPIFNQAVQYSYATIIPAIGSPAAVQTFKWTLSALLILPQSVLLGMTFPLMSAALLRIFPGTPGRSIAMLYFTNSTGAAVGVLASGFFLIRMVGLPGTISIAGLINIILAAVVWRMAGQGGASSIKGEIPSEKTEAGANAAWYWSLLCASLVTGTASFLYEIGWIRMLSLVLGSSTHAFELMLSAFIFGLAFGGLWIQRRIDSVSDPVRFLVVVQIAMGLLALATLPLYERSFDVMQWLISTLAKTDTGYALFNLSSNMIALAIMLPATFCAGMTLPLITYTLLRQGNGERSVGAVYAMNTVGAIIGVFFAIHFGMPILGLKGLIATGAGMDMALGLFLLWRLKAQYVNRRVLITAAVLCLCAVFATLLFVKLDPYKMASGVYRTGHLIRSDNNTVPFHKDGKTATVSITVLDGAEMSIRTNGKPDASIMIDPNQPASADESTMVLAAALPLAYYPAARTIANIGMGSGLTTHTLLCNPRLNRVDTIEIEKEMVEAAKLFGRNVELAYTDPRSTITLDDAKTFFSSHNKKYDIIVSEPSNPWVSGVAGLFSAEFYGLVNRHMNEQGLFVQWLQLYEIDLDLVASVFKAMSSNFSDFVVYAPNYGDLLIIATNTGDLSRMDPALFSFPLLSAELERVHIAKMQDLDSRRIGDKKMLMPFFEAYPLRANSDYYPVLDQNAARTRFLGTNAQELIKLGSEPLPIADMLARPGAQHSDTDVTLSSFYQKTKSVQAAMALRDYYLRDTALPRYGDVDEETMQCAIALKGMYFKYQTMEDPNRRVFLFNAAKSTSPYLSKEESAALWKKLEAGPFAARFSTVEKMYVSLFKAIGQRDGAKMAAVAKRLLETEQDGTPSRMQYVLAAGMLGNLAQGDRDQAAGLWSKYHSLIRTAGKPIFLLHFLEAESGVH